MPKTPVPQSHGSGKALPGRGSGKCQSFPSRFMCGCWQCVQKISFEALPTSPSLCLRSEQCSLERLTAPTEISRSHLLDSAVYHEPCLHIQLYALTPPLCPTVYNKHTKFPGGCNYSIKESSPPDPSSSMCVCHSFSLSFLHSLNALVRSIEPKNYAVMQPVTEMNTILPEISRESLSAFSVH